MDNNQSAVVFGFIVVAFFVYITLKGELPIYAGLLLLSPQASNTNTQASVQASSSDIISGLISAAGV
jgi:hypothetical protein